MGQLAEWMGSVEEVGDAVGYAEGLEQAEWVELVDGVEVEENVLLVMQCHSDAAVDTVVRMFT